MRQLTIHNFGPLTDISIEINRLNIFIGPQSSGKSTIAKCISFGLWLEKDISLHQSAEHIDQGFINEQFLTYHKLGSYVRTDTYIEYRCEFFRFVFKPDEARVTVTGTPPVMMPKVAYIPSERNLVTLSNIAALKMGADYMRDFVFDWLLLRGKYSRTDTFQLLDLGVSYYYEDNRGDRIILSDGKEISLSEASSGLQSVTPLLASIHYCTQWIYDHKPDISYERRLLLHRQLLKRLQIVDPSLNPEQVFDELGQGKTIMVDVKDMNHPDAPGAPTDLRMVLDTYSSQVAKPQFTAMVIEEPELNLFPLTQYELVKHIGTAFNRHAQNVFVITTHSPYVMASFNNLIEAYHAAERLGDSARGDDIDRKSAINHHLVGAYSLHDGVATDIFDTEADLISATALDSASDRIEQDFNQLIAL